MVEEPRPFEMNGRRQGPEGGGPQPRTRIHQLDELFARLGKVGGLAQAADAAGDFFLLEYSTNGGSSWNTLASIGDSTSNAAWTTSTAQIPAGSTVQLRVQCSDGASPGDLVECGIDDVSICDN